MTAKTPSDLKIAVLHTGRAIEGSVPAHGDYDDMCKALLGRAPDQATTFAVLDGEFPQGLEPFDVFIVTGSKHGAYEDHDWIPPLEDLIRQIYQSDKKLLGICFGHQIIAQALGGAVVKSEKGFGIGVMDYALVDSNGQGKDISLYAWHQDQVITCPPNAEIIAKSDFCPIAGLKYEDKALTIQAHPEFTKGYMQVLAGTNKAALPQSRIDAAMSSLDQPVDAGIIQAMFIDFMAA